jgi:hypothetical protein
MANYLVTLLFPTTARTEARTIAEAITGVSHSSAFPAGLDYTGGTASRVPVHLSVLESRIRWARGLAMQSLNCAWVLRDSNCVVLESDIAEIVVGNTVRDPAIQTVMQGAFTEGGDTPVGTDNLTLFGRDFYVKTTGDPLPGVLTPSENCVFASPSGDVVCLALRDISGTYYGAEVKATAVTGYGTYKFSTAGRVNNLVTNPTFGAFTYASNADGGVEPYEEQGFEIGGIVNGDTCHMYHVRTDVAYASSINVVQVFDPGSAMIFHWEMEWLPGKLSWKVFSSANVLIASNSSTLAIDDPLGATWRFNAWSYLAPPSAEVRLSFFDYSFTPA